MSSELEELKSKYPYVTAWAQLIHPDKDYFLDMYLQEAVKFKAKHDSVFRIKNKWYSYKDISNPYTLKKLDSLLNKA